MYDGQNLANDRNAVVVSVSYRVGPLGFTAHPALTAESSHHSSGNYGILDQIVALKWVKRNITSFGGDAARVTIFGESAGAINTCTLLASPLAHGLFSKAIMESGFCTAITLAEREAFGVDFATSIGCTDPATAAACLRAAPLSKMTVAFDGTLPSGIDPLAAQRAIPAGNIDGWLLTQPPLAAMQGEHNHVPLIIGSNANENALFLITKTVLSCSAYQTEVSTSYPAHKDQILALYPCNALNPKQALIDLSTDMFFTCSARRAARAMTAGQSEPVRRYVFTYANSTLGAYHTAEIPFVFGTYKGLLPNPTEDALSTAIQTYWMGLATGGDPNAGSAVAWPAYLTAQDNALELGTNIHAIDHIATARCDFWDSVTPQ
jgi:para-nitrobenzyl esterase